MIKEETIKRFANLIDPEWHGSVPVEAEVLYDIAVEEFLSHLPDMSEEEIPSMDEATDNNGRFHIAEYTKLVIQAYQSKIKEMLG